MADAIPPLTDAQRELLQDKYVLWVRASREGALDYRDYHRRAAEALKAALCIAADYLPPGQTCANHPDRPSRVNLDGDELCQECADAWVRGEGAHAAYLDAEEKAHAHG